MKKILVAAIAALTMGASAFAGGDVVVEQPVQLVVEQSKDFYVGGSVQAVLNDRIEYFNTETFLADAAYGVGIQAGYVFFRSGDFSTAVEGRYTFSWADNSLGDTGVLSGFLKPAYDFGGVAVYGLVGYSNVDINVFGSESDWAYGLGLEADINSDWAVFVDYTVNPDFEAGFDITKFDNEIVTVGLNYKF